MNLGKSKSDSELMVMANAIKSYDIIAIQEVVAGYGGAKAVSRLVAILNTKGSKWDYVISNPTTSANPSTRERYAFIWKPSSVSKTGNIIQVTFDVINNTHGVATTTTTGTVQLSSSTSIATTGTNVVTNSVLNGLLATANTNLSGTTNENKLAPAAHHHDSLYLGIGANATTASQWSTARTVTFATGTVTGSFSINGSADVGNVALTYTGNEFYYTTAESNINDLIFETDPA
jgi:hypothetical protein